MIAECFWSWTTAVSRSDFRDQDTKGLDELSGISYHRNGKLLLFSLFLIAKFHYALVTTLGAQHFKVLLCSPSC